MKIPGQGFQKIYNTVWQIYSGQ